MDVTFSLKFISSENLASAKGKKNKFYERQKKSWHEQGAKKGDLLRERQKKSQHEQAGGQNMRLLVKQRLTWGERQVRNCMKIVKGSVCSSQSKKNLSFHFIRRTIQP